MPPPGDPTLDDVICVEACAGLRAATPSSRVQLRGRDLAEVAEVSFAASSGGRVSTAPAAVSDRTVEAVVPEDAATGTVGVATGYGATAETPQELEVVARSAIPDGGEFRLRSAKAKPRKTYFDGTRKPQVRYLFGGGSPTDVRVDVLNRSSDELVASFIDPAAEPNATNVAKWDGRTTDGRLAPNGRYEFRVGTVAGAAAETTDHAAFDYYKFRFPLDARHSYGDGFGSERNHQGQDLFARCGSEVLAARGGRVQWNRTHAAAGNYLVIDGKRTKMDYMYAHLRERSLLRKGDRVRTGEVIGRVGDTGNASGCHLHFEIWSAPGWYEGGTALPTVRRALKLWDRWS